MDAQKKIFLYGNKVKIYLYMYECYDKNGNMLGYVPTKYEAKDISFNLKNLSLDVERVS